MTIQREFAIAHQSKIARLVVDSKLTDPTYVKLRFASKALPGRGAAMTDNISSLHDPPSDLGKLIPPTHLEPDDSQPGPSDRLAYLNNWEPPTENEWRRATWIVARELVRGIVGSNWRFFAKLEVLSTRKRPHGH